VTSTPVISAHNIDSVVPHLLNVAPELADHLGEGARDAPHSLHVLALGTQLALMLILEVLCHHPRHLPTITTHRDGYYSHLMSKR